MERSSVPAAFAGPRRYGQCAPILQSAIFEGIWIRVSEKLDEGGFDAILLAAAGLKRMGWQDRVTMRWTRWNSSQP